MSMDLKAAENEIESYVQPDNKKQSLVKTIIIFLSIAVAIFLSYIIYILYRNYSNIEKIKVDIQSADVVSFCEGGVEFKIVLNYEHDLDLGLSVTLEDLSFQLLSKEKYVQAGKINLASPIHVASKKALKEITVKIHLDNFNIVQDFITNLMSNFSFFITFDLKAKFDILFHPISFIRIPYNYNFEYKGTLSVFNRKYIFLNDKLIYEKKNSSKTTLEVNYDVSLTSVTFSVCKLIKDIPFYFSFPKVSIDVFGWSPDTKSFKRLIEKFSITELSMERGNFCLRGETGILNADILAVGNFYKYFKSVGYFSVKVKLSSNNSANEISYCPYLIDNIKERTFSISIVKKLNILEE